MADRITIDADVISTHVSHLRTVHDGVALAQDAAGSVDLGGGAFGIMCSFMVAPAQIVQSMAQGAIGSAADMVDRSITEIQGVASDFAALEHALKTELDKSTAELSR